MTLLNRRSPSSRVERIQQQGDIHLQVVVVGEGEHGVLKPEAVEFALTSNPAYDRNVTVGNEGGYVRIGVRVVIGHELLGPVVVVLDYHHAVPAVEFVLAVQDSGAYAVVVDYGPLVGAAQYHGLVYAVA